MEDQLAEYRKRKEKERNSQQSVFKRIFSTSQNHITKSDTSRESKHNLNSSVAGAPGTVDGRHDNQPPAQSVQSDWKYYVPLGLNIILWLLLWKFFIEIGFGAVFFIVSSSYLMYKNTRTGPRESNRLSAYSVFNPNHERLDGTFTAEQFEKELRFGATSVR